MATLSQANKAREEHSDFLKSLGAHSIGVDQIGEGGEKSFAVIAYLEKEVADVPASLEIEWKHAKHQVPLVTRISKRFQPESLP